MWPRRRERVDVDPEPVVVDWRRHLLDGDDIGMERVGRPAHPERLRPGVEREGRVLIERVAELDHRLLLELGGADAALRSDAAEGALDGAEAAHEEMIAGLALVILADRDDQWKIHRFSLHVELLNRDHARRLHPGGAAIESAPREAAESVGELRGLLLFVLEPSPERGREVAAALQARDAFVDARRDRRADVDELEVEGPAGVQPERRRRTVLDIERQANRRRRIGRGKRAGLFGHIGRFDRRSLLRPACAGGGAAHCGHPREGDHQRTRCRAAAEESSTMPGESFCTHLALFHLQGCDPSVMPDHSHLQSTGAPSVTSMHYRENMRSMVSFIPPVHDADACRQIDDKWVLTRAGGDQSKRHARSNPRSAVFAGRKAAPRGLRADAFFSISLHRSVVRHIVVERLSIVAKQLVSCESDCSPGRGRVPLPEVHAIQVQRALRPRPLSEVVPGSTGHLVVSVGGPFLLCPEP